MTASRAGALGDRLRAVAIAVGVSEQDEVLDGDEQALMRRVEELVGPPAAEYSYLLLAVLGAVVPTEEEVVEFLRAWRVSDLPSVLGRQPRPTVRRRVERAHRPVRVESGTIVDVTDTAQSLFTTGIQRVARETMARWTRDRSVLLVAWDAEFRCLRTLDGEMRERAGAAPSAEQPIEIVIPFRATVVLPEIAVEPRRAARLRSIARFSGSRTTAVGFDCIPITTAEAAGPGMPGAFSKYLSCLAHFDLVLPISEDSAGEYRGWRSMLRGAGLDGPRIEPLDLPSTGVPAASPSIASTSSQLGLDDEPVVLAIGSHEPRKNHVNFLHAAELNWRAGHRFSVVMVGGNSWDTAVFDAMVARLRRKGRRIVTIARAEDQTVWDLYRIARFSVFCSLNEGFGLPVVESLASGTPVITSDFGSTRALGEGHGALLVSPHDVNAMAHAMSDLLTGEDLLEELRSAASTLPTSTWDDYADSLWRAVVAEEDTGTPTPAVGLRV